MEAAPSPAAGDWQSLPPRGAVLAALGNALALGAPMLAAGIVLCTAFDALSPWQWQVVPALVSTGIALGGWLGLRRHRRVRWRLGDDAFALRRGNWWQSETHVPISRVQHLDLKRGPLERMMGLSTLVVHTAGTRMATVNVAGLDADDAERLRNRLAHQLDHDDAL